MIKLKRDDVELSIATLVKRSMEGYKCESEIERIWNCSLCPLSYMRDSGLRKHPDESEVAQVYVDATSV